METAILFIVIAFIILSAIAINEHWDLIKEKLYGIYLDMCWRWLLVKIWYISFKRFTGQMIKWTKKIKPGDDYKEGHPLFI